MGRVTFEVQDSVATLTFTNEGRMNAMDGDVEEGLKNYAMEAKGRTDIGALILRGGGEQSFCSGADLKYVQTFPDREDGFWRLDSHIRDFRKVMRELPFPTVAMMHRICYGGGCYIAASTDFRFSDPELKLAIPAVRTRRFYSVTALRRLGDLMGHTNIKRIMLGDEVFKADRLHQWGFIDEVHPAAELEEKTIAFAKKMAAQPRDVVNVYMDTLRAIEKNDLGEAQKLTDAAWAREKDVQAAKKAKG